MYVTCRGAKAAFKSSHLKVGQLNPAVKEPGRRHIKQEKYYHVCWDQP